MSILVKSRIPETLLKVIDNDGKLIDSSYRPQLTDAQLLDAYYWMNLSRQKDKKMLMWQRNGKMLNFAPNMGEEALQIAVGLAMRKGDWLLPSFRADAIMAFRGVPLHREMLYWGGSEAGSAFDADLNVLPVNIVIATQISQAAGVGFALKQQGKKNAAVTFIGDGGTAEGEFYEALNMAAIHKWNLLVCINNNQFAISTRTKNESAVKDISTKAVAFDVPRVRVDGNDLLASYDAAKDALAYVRAGEGPVIIEFVTYRQGPHTTSDDPTIYRSQAELDEAMKSDPIDRLRKYLVSRGLWDEAKEAEMKQKVDDLIESEYRLAQEKIATTVDDVFDNQYERSYPDLEEQKELAKRYYR